MYGDSLSVLDRLNPSLIDSEQTILKIALEGIAWARMGQVDRAEQILSKGDSLCFLKTVASCGEISRAKGLIAFDQGKFEEARKQFLESLALSHAQQDSSVSLTAPLNLGSVALQVSRYDEAITWSNAAYRAGAKIGDENQVQGALGNLGWAYLGLGDADAALRYFLDAEARATKLGNLRDQVKWLKSIAYVDREYGELAQARDTLRLTLEFATRLNSRQDITETLEDLSHVSVEIGDLDSAAQYIDRSAPLAASSGNALDISYVSLSRGKLAAARRQDAAAQALFKAVVSDPASQVAMRFGAEHELAKLLEIEGNTAKASVAYQTALTTFESARDQLKDDDSKLPFLANATRIYDDYIHFLVSQGKTQEALLVADQSRARTLAQGLGQNEPAKEFHTASFPPQAVARKAGATLLFYWLGERQSYLWAVTPEKTALFTLPPQREIAPLLDRYRKSLLGADDPLLATPSTGQALYTMLVAPAASLIRPNANVMILADGPLSLLNFETLIVPEAKSGSKTRPAHYWIEDATLSAAPSLAMLEAAKPGRKSPTPAHDKLLLLGDAVSPGADYPELPFAALEMQRVRQHFAAQDEVVFARRQATPAKYLASNPRQFDYIHFVSHGVASRTDPLDSAIILSRADDSSTNGSGAAEHQDSFKLYAREVMQQTIDARLVTISACYGSGTRAYAGEGLVGLSWAFLRAGAHSAIGALWEVSDNSTPQLMDALYRGLEDGQSPAAALRQAKLAMLHSNNSFRKPFYWAPFQIYTRV